MEHVFSAVRKIFPGHEILQTIREPFVRSIEERARHVQVFGRGVARVPVQLYLPARVLVVDNIVIARN